MQGECAMGTLTVRDIPDNQLAGLAEDAKRNNRSMSAEVRELIAERDRKRRLAQILAEMREFRKRNPLKLPDGMTSLDLLREERESW
jgi:plasmid stability protein